MNIIDKSNPNVPENDQTRLKLLVWLLFTHKNILVNKKVAAVYHFVNMLFFAD